MSTRPPRLANYLEPPLDGARIDRTWAAIERRSPRVVLS